MKLQNKILFSILTVFILSLIFLGFLVFTNSRAIFENQIIDQLKSVSQINENNIHTFLDGQENKIELIANQNDLSNEELEQMTQIDDTFYDLFVINSSGYVLRSSNPARLGLYRGNRSYFINARNKTYVNPIYFALVPGEYSIAVATPFHNGVLVGSMKLDVLNKLIADRTGLGASGETLLAFEEDNTSIIYFSKRRFSNISFEKLPIEQVKNRPIYFAIMQQHTIFKDLKDYRNVSVLAVTNFIPSINVGMVTKMDSQEAFKQVLSLQNLTFFIVLVLILVMALIIYLISRNISNELKILTADIDKITKGDLEIQLKKSNTLEITSLIESLNRILASMKLAILRTGIAKSELGIGEAIKAKEEAENMYRAIIEASSDRIFLVDKNYTYVSVNKTLADSFGKKPEELIGKKVSELFSKPAAIQVIRNLKKVFKAGKSLDFQEKIIIAGQEQLLSTKLSPVIDSNKDVVFVAGIIRILSETSKKLTKSSEEDKS